MKNLISLVKLLLAQGEFGTDTIELKCGYERRLNGQDFKTNLTKAIAEIETSHSAQPSFNDERLQQLEGSLGKLRIPSSLGWLELFIINRNQTPENMWANVVFEVKRDANRLMTNAYSVGVFLPPYLANDRRFSWPTEKVFLCAAVASALSDYFGDIEIIRMELNR